MSERAPQIGDVVRLKSSGPKMTVGQFTDQLKGFTVPDGKTVCCSWFDHMNTLHRDVFHIASLKIVAMGNDDD